MRRSARRPKAKCKAPILLLQCGWSLAPFAIVWRRCRAARALINGDRTCCFHFDLPQNKLPTIFVIAFFIFMIFRFMVVVGVGVGVGAGVTFSLLQFRAVCVCALVAGKQNIALFDSFAAFAITKYILQAIYYCCCCCCC